MASWCSKCGRNYCECEAIQERAGNFARFNNYKPLSSNFQSYGFAKGFYGSSTKLEYGIAGYRPSSVVCEKCGKSIPRLELPLHNC